MFIYAKVCKSMLISWITSVMLNHRSLLKSGQILVHLNSSSLPALNCLLCLQANSVNNLTCAIFCWPSFGHIPLLCFLERLLGLTWTEKIGPLSWRPCSHQRKQHDLFQPISTCFKSLKASAPSVSVESLASQVWFMPLAKASISAVFAARLLHQRQPLKCWQNTYLLHALLLFNVAKFTL